MTHPPRTLPLLRGATGLFLCLSPALGLLLLPGCRSAPPPAPRSTLQTEADQAAAAAQRHWTRHQWPQAAQRWHDAAQRYALLHQPAQEAAARHNEGLARLRLTDFDSAERCFQTAAAINQHLNTSPDWWRNQIALLQTDRQRGNTNAWQQRWQTLNTQDTASLPAETRAAFANETGLIQLRAGQFTQAESHFRQAHHGYLQTHDTLGQAVTQANLALCLEHDTRPEEALAAWRSALPLFQETGDAHGIATCLAGQGRTLAAQKRDWNEAEDLLTRAARNFHQLGATNAVEQTLGTLQELLRTQGKSAEADGVRRRLDPLSPTGAAH